MKTHKNIAHKNVALIGMPAAGKSSIGRLLAEKLDFEFIDSDDLIQSGEGRTLAEIICDKGLARFLEIEEKHIIGITPERHVIATGGSAVYSKKAMDHLSRTCTVLYLFIDLPGLLTRLSDITSRGVAIKPGETIEDLYAERTPLYDQYCDIRIDCSSLTLEQVVENAVAALI
ncbi:MAG: shikimate kinase [Deltaproteobacteria bacterium RIFOXYC2_FULL_48_10]|nr:MAG: shikimate kinase [Deltaproteobacteria bacterium RIFOXYC2_FULL_48_10]OGR56239.1 MAG: shikimate kinase [Desulfobacula sp. RIFOXYB2_FULL_45_6]